MEAIIQVLESTMATRDPYTVGHQRRVSQIACNIGREMGLSKDRLCDLRMAGILHDFGKIAIPSGLLSKPGNLTSLEFALIKTHPQVAYYILEPISLPCKPREWNLQNLHKRFSLRKPCAILRSRIRLGQRRGTSSGYPIRTAGSKTNFQRRRPRLLQISDYEDVFTGKEMDRSTD